MAARDPKTTVTRTIVDHIGVILDDDGNPAAVGIRWESGPETLKYFFDPAGADYEVLITIGEPRSRSIRPIQDEPVHFLTRIPVTVTTVNKPLTGVVLFSTAAEMQYKVTIALRAAIIIHAQSAVGVPPAFTMRLVEDVAVHKRIGGLDVWQATHYVLYETDYGW